MGPAGHGGTRGEVRIHATDLACKIVTLVYIERMPPRTFMEKEREDAPTGASSHFASCAKGSNYYDTEYHQPRDLATNHR